jgi:hypothetical protein
VLPQRYPHFGQIRATIIFELPHMPSRGGPFVAIAAHCSSPPSEDLAAGVNGIARASRRPSGLDCSRALSQGRGVPTTPVGADSAQVSRDLDRPPTGCRVVPRLALRCGQTRRP